MTDHKTGVPVAVLGAGLIGAAVARNLARKGFEVRAWNRTADKAQLLASDDVVPFDNPADAVRGAAIVVTVLKDGPAVMEVMMAALPGLHQGTMWLQLSTVGIEAINSLADFAAAHAMALYDSPVRGTRQPAEQGSGIPPSESFKRDTNASASAKNAEAG